MTRHLLAFVALISGLAALNSPAHASLVHALSNDVGVSADASQSSSKAECPCKTDPTKPATACRDKAAKPAARTLPRALRLPVLMGVERAYE